MNGARDRPSCGAALLEMAMTPLEKLLCIILALTCALIVLAAPGDISSQPTLWQEGVLCRAQDRHVKLCATEDLKALYRKNSDALSGSNSWPALISAHNSYSKANAGTAAVAAARSASTQFVVLARLLQPKEANVQFAQAFCVSIGGRLAYWNNATEYAALAATVRGVAAELKSPVYAYVGAVQVPGAKQPQEGWLWLHKLASIPKSFPWAAGEPNDHNEGKQQGHREDCAVLATYHKASEVNITDDFPCNYATPAGKFIFNGHNPHLVVACRI